MRTEVELTSFDIRFLDLEKSMHFFSVFSFMTLAHVLIIIGVSLKSYRAFQHNTCLS